MENETIEQTIRQELKVLINKVHLAVVAESYKLSDKEVLGMVIAKYFEWDGTAILQTAAYAMEDANYSKDCNTLMMMANEEILT